MAGIYKHAMSVYFERAAIIGVGLIGASIARALKKHKLAGHVIGYGRNMDKLHNAIELGYLDSASDELEGVCANADLIVLATPPGTFKDILSKIAPTIEPGALVIDAGSVKGSLVNELETLVPEGAFFVPCHPIAGGEQAGHKASRDDLFEGAQCIITPSDKTNKDALAQARALWEGMKSRVSIMDPFHHDEVYALVSHLPHLAAFALVDTALGMNDRCLEHTGAGFMDTTRIAGSSPELWVDIAMNNASNIEKSLELYIDKLSNIKDSLSTNNRAALLEAFSRAQKARKSIKGSKKGE